MNIPNKKMRVSRRALFMAAFSLLLIFQTLAGLSAQDGEFPAAAGVAFVEQSSEYGVNSFTPTFGYLVADFNNDGRDDILGSHHGKSPVLLINIDGQQFDDVAYLLPLAQEKDVHCPSAADFDNDGDIDILFAGGGEGSKAARDGTPNQLIRNMLIETGELAFEAVDAKIDYSAWRTRALIPHPTADGKSINILMQCIEDKNNNKPNLYFQPKGRKEFRFRQVRNNGLMQSVHTEGNSLFVDIDNDGDVDLLTVQNGSALVYFHENGHFLRDDDAFDLPSKAHSITAGDLNNDGLLDVIVGCAADRTGSDIFTLKKQLIQFDFNVDQAPPIDVEEEAPACDCGDIHPAASPSMKRDEIDAFSFSAKSEELRINFAFENHRVADDPTIVFIGRDSVNPESADTTITSEFAFGRPIFDKAGVYIWFAQDRWNVRWSYSNKLRTATGQIFGKGIRDVNFEELEPSESETVQDLVLLNRGEDGFELIDVPLFEHDMITQSLLALDFDNSGTVDVAVLRRGPRMAENGDPELFLNLGADGNGDLQFVRHNTRDLRSSDNDMFSAESLVAGLFDDNLFFDLFSTNGQGLKPNEGPRHLFINATINDNEAVVVRLQPTVSNRDALGAKVWLRDKDGALLGYREVFYQGRNQLNARNVHFGLGPKEEMNAPLRAFIRWPNGTEQEARVNPGKIITISENQR